MQGKVPMMSLEALHQLHIFIFIMALAHVIFCVTTMLLGGARIRQWRHWEQSIRRASKEHHGHHIHIKHLQSFKERAGRYWRRFTVISWLAAFFKQFHGSVTKSDYVVLRSAFISLLLVVGTKLEHIITELAQDIAEKKSGDTNGEVGIRPSDELFWFKSPKLVLYLIHFILFQNSFEIAFFVWIMMGSNFKPGIFKHTTENTLIDWARGTKAAHLITQPFEGISISERPTASGDISSTIHLSP